MGLRKLGRGFAETPVLIICLEARPGTVLARLRAELFERDICVRDARGEQIKRAPW